MDFAPTVPDAHFEDIICFFTVESNKDLCYLVSVVEACHFFWCKALHVFTPSSFQKKVAFSGLSLT